MDHIVRCPLVPDHIELPDVHFSTLLLDSITSSSTTALVVAYYYNIQYFYLFHARVQAFVLLQFSTDDNNFYKQLLPVCRRKLVIINRIITIIAILELKAHCCSHHTMGSSLYLLDWWTTGLMNAVQSLILWIYNSLY